MDSLLDINLFCEMKYNTLLFVIKKMDELVFIPQHNIDI